MAIKKEVGFCDFCDEFRGSQYENNFSYEGKKALYEYLEQYSDDTGEEIELDIVSLCCDFDEYDSLEDIKEVYPKIETLEDLQDNTQVIECENNHIIIQAY